MSNLSVLECYAALQAEGKYMGIPHIIVRMTGCPMRCSFDDSLCDSSYTSWFPEKGSIGEEEIYEFYANHFHIKYTMITGGEPTSNTNLLVKLVNIAKKFKHFVTIETAGIKFVKTQADFISISPKLRNSVPELKKYVVGDKEIRVTQCMINRHEHFRTNYGEMINLIDFHKDFQIKPVISDIEKDMVEVKELLKKLNVKRNKVYLMPAGSTSAELKVGRSDLMEYCIKEGYNYTDRLHIIAYGNKRGV